ncbi:MAG: gliding motility-associated C-terminal domain-containing protein [Saprospiraceae bacterium]|nr:gliding motility-associated C-terminal domain-containing protein [Candidatus Brachybacter algidus]
MEATGSVTVLPPASNLLIFSVDDGGTFTELPIFKGLLPGNYTLIYKEPISGCQSSTNFVIDPPPVVTANWKLTSKACTSALTNFIDVLSTQNMTMPIFIYVDNNLMVTTSKLPVKIDNLSIGDHTLIITDSKGCEITDDFSITESSNIDIDIQGVYVVDEGEEVTLIPEISGPYTSIIWTPGTYLSCTTCLTPRCKPKKEITYTVEVTNEQGCKDEITVRVVIRKKINIFVPNIFTPNGDGVNDLVTVFTDDNIKIIDNLKIFSRWGELVFERSNFIPNIESEGWDGIFKNQEMNPAVFAWVVEVNIPGEGIRILKGDITLIR